MCSSDLEACAPILESVIKAQVAAGQTPDGKAWAERRSGGRAGANAASDVHVVAIGSVLQVSVEGKSVHLHYGRTGKQVARHMIPEFGDPLPTQYAQAIERGISKVIGKRST